MKPDTERKRTWVESRLNHELTEFQRDAVELLSQAFNTGIYNLATNWEKVDWNWGDGVRFKIRRSMATYDFDHLTRLVILAHDMCIRVELTALAPNVMGIAMWRRNKRDGSMYERHPTMEQAIEKVRR